MVRRGFRMKLYRGKEEEYKKRHDELWPEMAEMIRAHGGRNYSIFLDPETGDLFGYVELDAESLWSRSAETEICKKWWDYMADIMETNPDNSPVSREMKPVFHLE
ncbi:MAG: L-rhamnose mutarotase [Synergistaceae bacterium]|jgi:L-rhamnose mutarotase|nr:L-rhamnose mutarotase [Synergistaceae bacterium]